MNRPSPAQAIKGIILLAFAGASVAFAKYGHKWLGKAIECGVESFDKKVIGTDVEIGSLDVSIRKGRVEMKGMTVQNPPGWTEPYIFKVDQVLIDINMASLIRSRGQRVEVTAIKFNGVDAIVEFEGALPTGKSNVQDILDFMSKNTDEEKPSEASAPKCVVATQPKVKGDKSSREIVVHKLEIKDLGARVATRMVGSRFAVGDIDYPDFSQNTGACMIDDVVCIVLKTLTKTVLSNVTGKGFADWLM